ncbi:hypothetical protein HAX54_053142, partial [Datura stramonium]|nr:hypothetical protein [Datura stramonium]
MGLCVDESVKGRGVSLNGDMEVGDDLQVVSFASKIRRDVGRSETRDDNKSPSKRIWK